MARGILCLGPHGKQMKTQLHFEYIINESIWMPGNVCVCAWTNCFKCGVVLQQRAELLVHGGGLVRAKRVLP